MEMIKDDLLELFVNLLLLAKNNIPLPFNGSLLQFRVLQNIGKDFDRLLNIVLEGFGIVNGIFTLYPKKKKNSLVRIKAVVYGAGPDILTEV